MESHGTFGHTIVRLQNISIMSRTEICYITCCLETQTVAPTISGLQCIKRFVQYQYNHPYKAILYLLILMMDQISSDLHIVGIQLKNTQHIIV